MNTVTRKKIAELIRLLEEMADPPEGSAYNANLSPIQIATIDEAIGILKGYLRVLIMLTQFRVTFIAFFSHYPELFGEQDDKGPFD